MANIIDAEIAEMKAVCKNLAKGATWEFACETRYFLPRLLDAYEQVVKERDALKAQITDIGRALYELTKGLPSAVPYEEP